MYLRPIGKYILYLYVSPVYCRLDAVLFSGHGETKGFLRPDSEYTVYLSNSFPFSQVWTQLFLDTTLSCSQVPSDLKPRNPYYLCASAYYPLLVIYVVSAIWHGCYDIQNTLLGIFSIFLSSREDANVLLFLLLQLNSTSTNIRNGCPYA